MRDRLHRDPFLFLLLLGALGFATFCLAVTWWYFRDGALLLGIAVTVGVAVALIRWRG
jgi:hypothetical protein